MHVKRKEKLLRGNWHRCQNLPRGSLKFVYLVVVCVEVDHNFAISQVELWERNDRVPCCREMAPPWSLLRDRFQQIACC